MKSLRELNLDNHFSLYEILKIITPKEELHSLPPENTIESQLIEFSCSCSREKIIQTVSSYLDEKTVFGDQKELDFTCHYCKQLYIISQNEIQERKNSIHNIQK
jgi:redox-regulated HSP33 family molecular chaperone